VIFAAMTVSQYWRMQRIRPPEMTQPMMMGTVNVNDKTGVSKREPIRPPTSAQNPVREHIAINTAAVNSAVFLMFRRRCVSSARM